ncbi:hypothetical protein [Trabulsiella odontotermitis]|uniref:bestrophin-like domain n=1 Tax=Trabulsiella odontotermitis TaxID=379893 RepID=UPI0006761934|nr:hypothetical protein [Trabulsiella odontotermitis]
MAYYFMLPAADDVLLLAVIFSLLIMSSYIGRYLNYSRDAPPSDGDLIITTGTLALSVLLIGFSFSVSINGFVTLKQAQVREAQSVEKAWQYTRLLPATVQKQAWGLLSQYLDERIAFFRDTSLQGERTRNRLSEEEQQRLWSLVIPEVIRQPSPVMDSLLTAYSDLRSSQQQTTAVHQRKIPDAAWLVLIVFSMTACVLAGRLDAGRPRAGIPLMVLPVMISLSLFLVAEIDIPGEGIIRVTPDELERVAFTLPPVSEEVRNDSTHSVYHAR